MGGMSDLRLEELSAANISAVNGLSLKPGQEQFVAPESYSAAAAVIDPGAAWQRAHVILQASTAPARQAERERQA